jgi:hypothetical protein
MDWATFWAIFSKTHLVTMAAIYGSKKNETFLPKRSFCCFISKLIMKKGYKQTHSAFSLMKLTNKQLVSA